MDALVVDVTESTWDSEVAASDLPVLVDFWAPWCGPCKAIEPTVASLAREYSGQVKVAKVNVDENPGLAAQYQVQAIPTLLYFAEGAVHDRVVGAVGKRTLVSRLGGLTAKA